MIQKDIVNELSKRILSGEIESNQKIVIDFQDGGIVFWNPKDSGVIARRNDEAIPSN